MRIIRDMNSGNLTAADKMSCLRDNRLVLNKLIQLLVERL